jgi:hypothetical protein
MVKIKCISEGCSISFFLSFFLSFSALSKESMCAWARLGYAQLAMINGGHEPMGGNFHHLYFLLQ